MREAKTEQDKESQKDRQGRTLGINIKMYYVVGIHNKQDSAKK